MTDQLESALDNFVGGMPMPDWAELMEQAQDLTAKGQLPPPVAQGAPAPKHKGKYVPGKKGWKGKGSIQQAQAPTAGFPSSHKKGGKSDLDPLAPLLKSSGSLSTKLAQAAEEMPPAPENLDQGAEDDIDVLSTISTVHTQQLDELEERLSLANEEIAKLKLDQQKIMSNYSALFREMVLLKDRMGSITQTPKREGTSLSAPAAHSSSREIVPAPELTPEASSARVVAGPPSWLKKKA